MYVLLKRKIERNNYANKEEMQTMLDTYFFAGRLTTDEYSELTTLLQEK